MEAVEGHTHSEIEAGSERGFGLVFAAFFTAVALWPLLGDGTVRYWALGLALLFLLVALGRPILLRPLNRLWFAIGLLLGRIVSPLVMMVIFAVAVVPTGLILRALGKDPLQLKFQSDRSSYWIERRDDIDSSMRDQF